MNCVFAIWILKHKLVSFAARPTREGHFGSAGFVALPCGVFVQVPSRLPGRRVVASGCQSKVEGPVLVSSLAGIGRYMCGPSCFGQKFCAASYFLVCSIAQGMALADLNRDAGQAIRRNCTTLGIRTMLQWSRFGEGGGRLQGSGSILLQDGGCLCESPSHELFVVFVPR